MLLGGLAVGPSTATALLWPHLEAEEMHLTCAEPGSQDCVRRKGSEVGLGLGRAGQPQARRRSCGRWGELGS